LTIVVALVVAACSKPAKSSSCSIIASRFRSTLRLASGSCATAADCGCYNPVIEEAGCGGVTDGVTAAKLGTIEADFHKASCPWPHVCAASACAPQCSSGKCE
jgi:hypothetical protein